MARGEQRSNREKKKPKEAKIKTIAAAPRAKRARRRDGSRTSRPAKRNRNGSRNLTTPNVDIAEPAGRLASRP